jgi:hypothetical protein
MADKFNLTIEGSPYRSLRFFPAWDELHPKFLHGLMHLIQDIQQKAKKFEIWTEIGTFNGESAVIFLGFKFVKKLHCVDIKTSHFAIKSLRSEIDSGRCVIHETTSVKASTTIDTTDVIYIDGNHSYEFIKEDIKTWWEKIPEGGVLAGHDYSSAWPDVKRAVDEFLLSHPELQLFKYADSSWAIFKP